MAGLSGVNAMKSKLRRSALDKVAAAEAALYVETEIEATEAKRRTPVDTGTLRGTIHVVGPFRKGRRIYCLIVAGGPAAPYAFEVHENLDAFHKVGQAKYIESVIIESRPNMGARVARRMKNAAA